ncbi:MAG: hypothetical protein NZ937_08760, partial [Armatimonadetes bacterium]|nr:hypothetical protein [Armatimonadota bacterium]
MRWISSLFLLALTSMSYGWHTQISLNGGGYWRTRAVVLLDNPSDKPQIGVQVIIPIGKTLPNLPFEGRNANEIRVCDEQGNELRFDIRSQEGEPRRKGKLQRDDLLSFLADVPPKGSTKYFVYADNPLAWEVSDFIKTGLTNGSFEVGKGEPFDWERVHEDAQHQLFWVEGVAKTGKRSVQTVVSEGAEPTWVKFHQTHIPVTPKATYRFQGWVRAENVKGFAGWFVHVFSDKGEWLINRVMNSGGGTYDWTPVEFTFNAPENARWATVGTVLFGTGTAWFDDASFDLADKTKSALKVRVVTLETRNLAERLQPSDWLSEPEWDERVPINVHNFDAQTVTVLVFA